MAMMMLKYDDGDDDDGDDDDDDDDDDVDDVAFFLFLYFSLFLPSFSFLLLLLRKTERSLIAYIERVMVLFHQRKGGQRVSENGLNGRCISGQLHDGLSFKSLAVQYISGLWRRCNR